MQNRDEALAVVAVAMNRSLGVDLSNEQIAIAYALCDQLSGRRRWRASSSIPPLNARLAVRRDRSLAAALPAFWAAMSGNVYVLVADDASAREDVELYRAIDDHLGGKIGVELDERGPEDLVDPRADQAGILIGADRIPPQSHQSLIVCLSPAATKRACRIRGGAGLPDL
ncbi:hypothetical protein E0H73_25795 [Kribbella pittospori]|uniref:Uncharacterized protein n=1 Tax=Kribbella pittospori TaxID=722689 RepID=A0A4V2MAC4_9ACTN|nr:hypothetical protein [Kribbella pittospori]TCC58732.1 hypothetical protein E0H73_25795 [Kribbella pittospori]